ncbi:hypothetical protein M409DRAFT_30644 [Zasmidium cellare ATCC 36951]|uniref:SnoaL-like domain-containing protein n=1 Tax=Zasmidium cellare ATCC 36951 TaxID=1080233 RepID=A0A6A6BXS2_ZASCE|nr:uncharacterized protein M409DRAFT_30644 [Zasmidium cellare ATCC 36951]KAF2158858.1 hypothetical protein M409DRAFT_30644 [Zasmidium cellare ATCC 36951]
MAPYPTESEIKQLMRHLSTDDFQPFYDRVAHDVTWDVPGSSSGSGHFTSLDQWRKIALGGTNEALASPLKFKLVHVIGGGDQAWAAVEMEALDAVSKTGTPYPQKYCWIMRFNEQGIVVQVRVYADTQLSQSMIEASR